MSTVIKENPPKSETKGLQNFTMQYDVKCRDTEYFDPYV